MSSKITDIDPGFVQFPVPGIDNNSQGFRDRYNIIKTNFDNAKSEISDLLDNSARTDGPNNFNGNTIQNANLTQVTFEVNTTAANPESTGVDESVDIPWPSGYLHEIKVNTTESPLPVEINFTDWPTEQNRYTEMKLIVYGTTGSEPRGIVFKSKNELTGIKYNGPEVFLDSEVNKHVFDVFSYDNGNTVYVKYVGLFE